MPRPRTLKTHLPIQFLPEKIWNIKPKLIHISRDPRDVAVSFFHFLKNLWRSTATIEEFMDEFMNDRVMYCPYDEHVLNYLNLKDDINILYLTYEWVTSNIDDAIKKVANFLGKEISKENFEKLKEHLKFDSMKSKKKLFFKFKFLIFCFLQIMTHVIIKFLWKKWTIKKFAI